MKVVVTGANGFIGRRVVTALTAQGRAPHAVTRRTPPDDLRRALRDADVVIHLAAVNRPAEPADYEENASLAWQLAEAVHAAREPLVLFSSSVQAELDNPYGRSKREAERAVESLGGRGARVVIYRLPNVFGPGARPNYNSVVATFAHNAALGLPLEVHDPARQITLVYVHDVVDAFLGRLDAPPPPGVEYGRVEPQVRVTLGELADAFTGYADARSRFALPAVSDTFARRLYATFLSYLPAGAFAYNLLVRKDGRGELAEFLKSDVAGQLFVSRTKPGVTRGNHFHHTKAEKFLVLEGEAVIRFRCVEGGGGVQVYRVSGRDFRVLDIPPDHTHSIENVGTGDLVVLFWASEVFDPNAPDTHSLNVLTT